MVREKSKLHPGTAQAVRPKHDGLLNDNDEFAEPPCRSLRAAQQLKVAPPDTESETHSWTALAALIRACSALTDLHYDVSRPLDQTLLDALQSSTCRLHLDTFFFRDGSRLGTLHPQDLSILMYDRLQSLKTRSLGYKVCGSEDYTHEATIDLLSNISPHLKHLSFMVDSIGARANMTSDLKSRKPRRPWNRLTSAPRAGPVPAAALKTLEIYGNEPISPLLLSNIFNRCNVSTVEILKMRLPYNHKFLTNLASNRPLPSLKTLVLGDDWPRFPDEDLADDSTASALLESLQPLEAIRFVSAINESLFAVTLRTHGFRLRRLWFDQPHSDSDFIFDLRRVKELQRACPLVEELSLTVPRSGGDATETTIYETLGALRRLSRLALQLHCDDADLHMARRDSDTTPTQSDFDDFDCRLAGRDQTFRDNYWHRPCNGQLRIAMINSAVDEGLACAIFRKIARAKPGLHDDYALSRLELRPVGQFYTYGSLELMLQLRNWWLVEADLEGRPSATRIRSPGDVIEESRGRYHGLDACMDPSVRTVFRKIWPERSEVWAKDVGGVEVQGSWAEDWKSVKLHGELG